MRIYSNIKDIINQLDVGTLTEERKAILQLLITFIQEKAVQKENIDLSFICTHNSRRSQLTQIWATVMANYFNIENVFCYSGGTEVTSVPKIILETLKIIGFKIKSDNVETNPKIQIKYAENTNPIILFSKKWNDVQNPKQEFCAILTCSNADQECPIIFGASKRIFIPYTDPKIFEATTHEKEKYHQINHQIATEMFYIFSHINPSL